MHLNKAIKPDLIVKLIELVIGGCLAPLSQLKTGYLLVCLPIKCLQYTHQDVVGLSKEGTLTLLGNNYFILHAGGSRSPETACALYGRPLQYNNFQLNFYILFNSSFNSIERIR